ncbi:MAG: hypothetical protein PGN34_13195 [Methylobacterium frigidaeris]
MPLQDRKKTTGFRAITRPPRSFRSGYDPVLDGVAHGLSEVFRPVPHPNTLQSTPTALSMDTAKPIDRK